MKKKSITKKKIKLNEIVLGVCLTIFIISACALGSDAIDRIRSSKEMKEIQKLSPVSKTEEGFDIAQTAETLKILAAINPDVVAWIYGDETSLNFPVVQCSNNDYYLVHSFTGTYTDAGAIFMDYENKPDFTDQNTVIYGHARFDGTMFSVLRNYRQQNFYEQHPYIIIITGGKVYYYEVFSVNALDAYYDYRSSDYGDGLESFCSYLKNNSYISSKVSVKNTDRIITLSTCTDVIENGRLVVFAVLKNPNGEDIDITSNEK